MVLIQTAAGEFEYAIAPMQADGTALLPLETIIKAMVSREHGTGTPEAPLPIVAIADGARSIRCRLEAVFGPKVTIILDWYHLRRKVRDLMGRIAQDKEQKRLHLRKILPDLWCGRVAPVREYLENQVQARSPGALQELLTYFRKHEGEIVDYGRRQRAEKTIGSGRMGKGVDLVVGHWQKKKGMSWSQVGSHALAVIKVVELNGQWSQLWFDAESQIA